MQSLEDAYSDSKSTGYVDVEPDEVRAGLTIISSMGRMSEYLCNWCGHKFVSSGGPQIECSNCPNTSIHERPPIARFDDNRFKDFSPEPPMYNKGEPEL